MSQLRDGLGDGRGMQDPAVKTWQEATAERASLDRATVQDAIDAQKSRDHAALKRDLRAKDMGKLKALADALNACGYYGTQGVLDDQDASRIVAIVRLHDA